MSVSWQNNDHEESVIFARNAGSVNTAKPASDLLVFSDGTLNSYDIFGAIASLTSNPQSLANLTPTAGQTSISLDLPTLNQSTLRVNAIDGRTPPTGAVFKSSGHLGGHMIVTGSEKADSVYVLDGSSVDATRLLGGIDLIYFRGNWLDYRKSVNATTGNFQFERDVAIGGTSYTERVTVAYSASSGDRLVFADGSIQISQSLRSSIVSQPTIASTSLGDAFNRSLITPGVAPNLTTLLGDTAKPLDPSSNLVLSVGESVTATPGKFITITEQSGGPGYREAAGGTPRQPVLIDATDSLRVKISGSGTSTKIIIDPDLLFDLDLASNYTLAVEGGAFVGSTSGIPSLSLQAVSFSTITPYSGDPTGITNAQTSYKLTTSGWVESGKWIDIESRGANSDDFANAQKLDASTGTYTFVFRDAEPLGSGNAQTGVKSTTDFNIGLQNFGPDDRLYIDDQFNDPSQVNSVDAFQQGSGTVGEGRLFVPFTQGGVSSQGTPELYIELAGGRASVESGIADPTIVGINNALDLPANISFLLIA